MKVDISGVVGIARLSEYIFPNPRSIECLSNVKNQWNSFGIRRRNYLSRPVFNGYKLDYVVEKIDFCDEDITSYLKIVKKKWNSLERNIRNVL